MHAALALWLLVNPPALAAGAWFGFDPLARAVLPMVSLLFLVCSIYGVAYLRIRAERQNRVFVSALLVMLGLLSLALQAQNLGLLWVAAEAATLVTVPLLHFNGTARAFEASWKYLLVGGTGIALSLLGSFCLGYASLLNAGGNGDLTFSALAGNYHLTRRRRYSHPWLITAWVLLLAGYGTKMGLAPMHTWKPDAYGEAPGMVGALLAGGTTTMAFVAMLRVKQVVDAAGGGADDAAHAAGVRLVFHARGRAVFAGHAGFQTDAGVFQRGTHGHSGRGRGAGRRGHLGGAVSCLDQQPDQRRAVFERRQHSPRGGRADGERSRRHGVVRAGVGADFRRRACLAITACPPFGPFFSELKIVLAAFTDQHSFTAAAVSAAVCCFAFFGLTPAGVRHRGRPAARRRAGDAANGSAKPPASSCRRCVSRGSRSGSAWPRRRCCATPGPPPPKFYSRRHESAPANFSC